MTFQITLVLDQGLKVENGYQFLTGAKPQQINSKNWMIEVMGGLSHGIENLQALSGIETCDPPTAKAWNVP